MPNITLDQLVAFAEQADKRFDALEANADKALDLNLEASGWTNDSGNAKFPYQYKLTVEGVTTASRADALLDADGQSAAAACGVCAVCDTAANTVIFMCRTAPTAAITGTLYIKNKAIFELVD